MVVAIGIGEGNPISPSGLVFRISVPKQVFLVEGPDRQFHICVFLRVCPEERGTTVLAKASDATWRGIVFGICGFREPSQLGSFNGMEVVDERAAVLAALRTLTSVRLSRC